MMIHCLRCQSTYADNATLTWYSRGRLLDCARRVWRNVLPNEGAMERPLRPLLESTAWVPLMPLNIENKFRFIYRRNFYYIFHVFITWLGKWPVRSRDIGVVSIPKCLSKHKVGTIIGPVQYKYVGQLCWWSKGRDKSGIRGQFWCETSDFIML